MSNLCVFLSCGLANSACPQPSALAFRHHRRQNLTILLDHSKRPYATPPGHRSMLAPPTCQTPNAAAACVDPGPGHDADRPRRPDDPVEPQELVEQCVVQHVPLRRKRMPLSRPARTLGGRISLDRGHVYRIESTGTRCGRLSIGALTSPDRIDIDPGRRHLSGSVAQTR